jgi:Flp pilus assembly protein TadB
MAERAVGELIKGITDDVLVLVRDEIELAKAELIPAAKNAGIGAGLFGAAGYFGINAALLLYIAAALGLYALGLPLWLSFLIIAVALLLVAGLCALIGRSRVKKAKPPKRTINQAKETVAAVKGAVQRGNAAANAPEIEGRVVERELR